MLRPQGELLSKPFSQLKVPTLAHSQWESDASTLHRSREQVALVLQGHAAQRALGGVVVDLDASIFFVAGQRVPVGEGVASGLSREIRSSQRFLNR